MYKVNKCLCVVVHAGGDFCFQSDTYEDEEVTEILLILQYGDI